MQDTCDETRRASSAAKNKAKLRLLPVKIFLARDPKLTECLTVYMYVYVCLSVEKYLCGGRKCALVMPN